MAYTIEVIQELFISAVLGLSDFGVEHGALGFQHETTGQYIFDVPDEPQKMYVRIEKGGETSIVSAINMTTSRSFDLPVTIVRSKSGDRVVLSPDWSRALDYLTDRVLPGIAVGPHSHRIGFGLEDAVEGRRFEPGLVCCNGAGDMTVKVFPFWYKNLAGEDKYFPGDDAFDLTSYQTATVDNWAWVKVGFNRTTETLTAVAGDDHELNDPLTEDLLGDIPFTNLVGLAGVRVKYTDTAIAEESRFADIRPFFTGTGGTGTGVNDATYLVNTAHADLTAEVVLSALATGILFNVNGAGAGVVKCNFTAAVDPAVTDDIDLGYVPGSRWLNLTTDKEFVCLDNTDGAAVWAETTGSGTVDAADVTYTPAVGTDPGDVADALDDARARLVVLEATGGRTNSLVFMGY